ncbi:MAG TPA: hypothetical protein VF595_09400 [Tepidisphaeraceae bacterium]|jgi:Spy/CpxP family protein refolding chaperone
MTRLVVITGFIVAFLAGVMAGVTIRRPGPPPASREAGGRQSFIANQLGLTADQQTQMKAIWQDVSRRGTPDQRGKRGGIRREQEEAVARLIRPEDRAAYDRTVAEFQAKLDQIETDGKRSFQQAVEKTKAILTPDQLKKYDELLARPGDRDKDREHPATRPNG